MSEQLVARGSSAALALPMTTNDQIHNTFVSANAHAFLPYVPTHCETDVKCMDVKPKTAYRPGDKTVEFDIPTTFADLLHRMYLTCNIAITFNVSPTDGISKKLSALGNYGSPATPFRDLWNTWVNNADKAALKAPLFFMHRLGIASLIEEWTMDHNSVNCDRGDRLRFRLERGLFDNEDEYLDRVVELNGGAPATCDLGITADSAGNGDFDIGTYFDYGQGVQGTDSTVNPNLLTQSIIKANRDIGATVMGALNLSQRQYYHSFLGLKQSTTAASASPYNEYQDTGAGGSSQTVTVRKYVIPVKFEVPYWGSYFGATQVLPLRNLRTMPRIQFSFVDAVNQARVLFMNHLLSYGANQCVTVEIQDPMLEMLMYNIPPAIMDTDFPFGRELSWYKPDIQRWNQSNYTITGQDFEFNINTIDRSVHALSIIVRRQKDMDQGFGEDNFLRAFKSFWFNVGGDGIGCKKAESAAYNLCHIKPRFFGKNTLDCYLDGPLPIYVKPMGLNGSIKNPGFGSLNFANFPNQLQIRGTWDPEFYKLFGPGGIEFDKAIRIDVIAWVHNVETYFNGNLTRQLQS